MESFAQALAAAIALEFGSQREFAEAMGCTEARVSQLTGGKQPVKPETMDAVVRTFTSWVLQERLQRAWVREFASPEIEHFEQLPGDTIIQQIRELADLGNPLRAVRLAERRRAIEPPGTHFWQRLTEEIVEAHLKLKQPGSALKELVGLRSRAEDAHDPEGLITAYWMKGSALRTVEHFDSKVLFAAHTTATDCLNAWKPQTLHERAFRDNRKTALLRDFGLDILRAARGRRLPEDAYRAAVESIERSTRIGNDPRVLLIGLTVRFQVEVQGGKVFRAEETLDEIKSMQDMGGVSPAKLDQFRAQILMERGETEEAVALLEQASATALENLHLQEHTRIQQQLAAAMLR